MQTSSELDDVVWCEKYNPSLEKKVTHFPYWRQGTSFSFWRSQHYVDDDIDDDTIIHVCTSHPLMILLIQDIKERSFETSQIKYLQFHLFWTNNNNPLWWETKQWKIESRSNNAPSTVLNKETSTVVADTASILLI